MDLIRTLRSRVTGVASKPRLTISKPQPHANPAYRVETSSISSQAIASPQFFSSLENSDPSSEGHSFASDNLHSIDTHMSRRASRKRKMGERSISTSEEMGMIRTWSTTSRFSADTFSSSGSNTWESEEIWRRDRRNGVEGIDASNARTRRRKSRSSRASKKPRTASSLFSKDFSPSKSTGVTMAERLRRKMARVSERLEGFALGTPDSVIPRRRADFGPPRTRPQGGVYSEGEDEGEYVVRTEDVFGVVKPLSIKSGKRSTKSNSTLQPSPLSPVFGNKPSSTATSDEVGRSFPNERVEFEDYGHWLNAGILDSEDDVEFSDEDEAENASSYHRATLVAVGGNAALRSALISPDRDEYGAVPSNSPSPIMVASAVMYTNVAEARRSCDTSATQESPSYQPSYDPPSASSTRVAATTSIERLKALGYTDADISADLLDAVASEYPLSPSKTTVRLVETCDHTVTLSPDSISSAAQLHHTRPTIVVQDLSSEAPDIPLHVVNTGRPFAFHPLLSVTGTSGRSTPISCTSTSSHRPVYVAVMEDGARLPEWLHFDPDALEFWGRPDDDHVGQLSIVVLRQPLLPEGSRVHGRRTPCTAMDDGDVVGRLILVVSCEWYKPSDLFVC
ncbi:hypothetical protein FRB99_000493 [Tulasnella sp. 403]|nr:hypothetical protein FRB99_000493 [Tulasnella sp. 403]